MDVNEASSLFLVDEVRQWETDCILGSSQLVHLEYTSDTLTKREDEPSLDHLTMLRSFCAINWTRRVPVPLEHLEMMTYREEAMKTKNSASPPLMNDVIISCQRLETLDLRDGLVSLERLLADEDVSRLRELYLSGVRVIEWPAACSWARLTSLTWLKLKIDSQEPLEALERVAVCRSIKLKSLLLVVTDNSISISNIRLAQCVSLLSRNLERLEIECDDANQLRGLVTAVDPRHTVQLVRVSFTCGDMAHRDIKDVLYRSARHFPHLAHLEVEGNFQSSLGNSWPQGGGVWPALRELVLYNTSYSVATIKQTKRYTAFWMQFAREMAPRLRRLRIEGFPSLATPHALCLLSHGTQLQSLELPDITIAPRDKRYSPLAKERTIITQPYATLRHLELSPYISSWWLAQVIRNCKQHVDLRFSC